MASLYVDRRGTVLKNEGEALVFYEEDRRVGTVPMAPLSRVFLRGDVRLSAQVLGKLGARGVGVIIQGGRKGEACLMMGRQHNDARRRLTQYRLAQQSDFCLRTAKRIVAAKLTAQHDALAGRLEEDPRWRFALTTAMSRLHTCLEQVPLQSDLASLRGIEGAGAAAYFGAFKELVAPSLGFAGRQRRPPPDPMNAVLSLTYTLLHAEAVLALHGVGLDPYIGFYHGLSYARESLACDVIEPLRPWVDMVCLGLFRSEVLRADDFSKTAEGCLMGKAGRARYYAAWEAEAEGLRKRLETLCSEFSADIVAEAGSAPTIDDEAVGWA